MSAYADTSFIVSLYIPDAHSDLATARMRETAPPLMLSALGELELVNALQLYVFRREIHESDLRAALAVFRADIASGALAVKPIGLHHVLPPRF